MGMMSNLNISNKPVNLSGASVKSVDADKVTTLYGKFKVKNSNKRLRWNLLWQVLILAAFFPVLSFVPGLCPDVRATNIVLQLILGVFYMMGAYSCIKFMCRVGSSTETDWHEDASTRFGKDAVDEVFHIMVMPTYKEPFTVIEATLATIEAQTVAHNLMVVVSLEQRSPERAEKRKLLEERFEGKFKRLLVTTHPRGLPGEIPGACSNRNWGVRRAVHQLLQEGELDISNTIVTLVDADTGFHPRYVECLTHGYLDNLHSRETMYQSPLLYNVKLDERWFFTRITGILRSFFMCGYLIPMGINVMSVYSIPLSLMKRARFFHPSYQMDDMTLCIGASAAIGRRVRIKHIAVPTLNGPTSGDTICAELKEWWVQGNRWTIGAAEVFHYFMVKWWGGSFTISSAAWLGFWLTYYYGYILCGSGMVGITYIICKPFLELYYADECYVDPSAGPNATVRTGNMFHSLEEEVKKVMPFELALLLWHYVVFYGVAFAMDRRVVSVLGISERGDIWYRNVVHFFLALPVMWAYCLVEYFSIAQLSVYGKAKCQHIPSKKDKLLGKVSGEQAKVTELADITQHQRLEVSPRTRPHSPARTPSAEAPPTPHHHVTAGSAPNTTPRELSQASCKHNSSRCESRVPLLFPARRPFKTQ